MLTSTKKITEEDVLHEVIEAHTSGGTIGTAVEHVQSKYAGHRLSKARLLELAQEYLAKHH